MHRRIVVTSLLLLLSSAAEARKVKILLRPIPTSQLQAELRPAHGRPRLVHLWASWCLPCVAEMPRLAAYLRQLEPRVLDIVTVSLDEPEHESAAFRVLSQAGGVPGETLLAQPTQALPIVKHIDPQWDGALPTTLLLDDQGLLVFSQRGVTELEQLSREVDRLAPSNSSRSEGGSPTSPTDHH